MINECANQILSDVAHGSDYSAMVRLIKVIQDMQKQIDELRQQVAKATGIPAPSQRDAQALQRPPGTAAYMEEYL